MLLLAAVLGGAWYRLGMREILHLAVLLAAVPLISATLLGVEVAVARVRVHVEVTRQTPGPGERTRLRIVLVHRLPFTLPVEVVWSPDPGGRLAVDARDVEEGAGDSSVHSPLDIPAGRGIRSGVDLVARARGASGITVSALVVPDSLGMARCRLRAGHRVEVLVLPSLRPVGEVDDLVGDLDGATVVAGLGEPGGNLRDHRDGDPLRLIHWKQTARQGRLLVNVPESSAGAHHWIHLVTDAEAHTHESFEAAVSVVATLVARALGGGDEVELGIGPRGGEALAVRSKTSVLRSLALVEEEEAAPGGGADALVGPPLWGLVVTGRATPRLVEDLRAGGGGTVLLTDTDPGDAQELPALDAWRWWVPRDGVS